MFQLLVFFTLLLAGSTVLAESSLERDYRSVVDGLSESVPEYMDDGDVPAVSVALVDDQRLVWSQGFGFEDIKSGKKASADTVYRIGALTTLFTTYATLQQVERGRLNLDQPLSRWLPEFKPRSRFRDSVAITPRHILSQHSGLPLSLFRGSWSSRPVSLQTLADQLQSVDVAYPPQTVHTYSNIGWALLGHLLAKQSGLAYEKLIQQQLLEPLQMSRSGFDLADSPITDLAMGYKQGKPRERLYARDTPALGMVSTVNDMSHFVHMIFAQGSWQDRRILSAASLDEAARVQNSDLSWDVHSPVGLGWLLNKLPLQGTGPVLTRFGSTLLHRSRVVLLPEHKLAVVVMANSSNAFPVLEKIVNQAVAGMLEVKAGIRQPELDTSADIPPKVDLPQADWADHYVTLAGLVKVEHASPAAGATLMGKSLYLTPLEQGWQGVGIRLFGFIPLRFGFIKDIKVKPVQIEDRQALLGYYQGNVRLLGTAVKPQALNHSNSWRKRVGEYEAINSDELLDWMDARTLTLKERDGLLFFAYKLPTWFDLEMEIPIEVIDDQTAVIPGYGSVMGETIRLAQDKQEELISYGGYLLKRK